MEDQRFNSGQQSAYDAIRERRCFVTLLAGPGGTGKSFVINALASERNAVVVAPTGVAALNVGGETIHSAFGVLPFRILDPEADSDPYDGNFRNLWGDRLEVLETADLLVIDEISMVRADLLDAVDRRMRQVRREPDVPFGGVQTVLVGDSYQLPPVLTGDQAKAFRSIRHHDGTPQWVSEWWFDSRVVREVMQDQQVEVARLTQPMRQDDMEFVGFLNRARRGRVTLADLRYVNNRVVGTRPVGVTVLHPNRRGADQINRKHISELDGPETTYFRKLGLLEPNVWWKDKNAPPEEVRLRPGALVSMTTNFRTWLPDEGRSVSHWLNGDTGRVLELDDSGATVRLNRTGRTHRLSAPTMSEEELADLAYDDTRGDTVPQYRHVAANGRVKRTMEAVAAQMPLRVAAAVTVHKSQGQTLDAVYVGGDNLGWASGLAYVALSRVRTIAGLHLERPLTAASFRVDPRVLEFRKALATLRDLEVLI